MLENIELWMAIAGLWIMHFKLLYDVREIKAVVKIEKVAHLCKK